MDDKLKSMVADMALKFFRDYHREFHNEGPMDADETGDISKLFNLYLDYYSGNVHGSEIEAKVAEIEAEASS